MLDSTLINTDVTGVILLFTVYSVEDYFIAL